MTAPDHLPHATDECVGEWQREREGDPWVCDACGQVHPASPENDKAAILEFCAGVTLRSEARRHRFKDLFAAPSPQPPRPFIELEEEEEEDKNPWE